MEFTENPQINASKKTMQPMIEVVARMHACVFEVGGRAGLEAPPSQPPSTFNLFFEVTFKQGGRLS